ncbi:MAG TPA: SUMF1/EgtB/PvdO family nonheme iron enzyme [Flavisolibacter sp.]|nr:SUMF1/EgtB/PvdO family nonheme iron enzyme [Flavisolibacter sp.]
MRKPVLLLFLLHFLNLSWSQSQGNNSRLPQSSSRTTAQKSQPVSPAAFEVLFATNEDCDLFINGERKGQVVKSDFLFLKLPAGNHQFMAVSATTQDALVDTIRVTQAGTNEFFIDLLYLVDQKNEERERIKMQTANPVLAIKSDRVGDRQPEARKMPLKDVEISIINSLLANMVEIKGGTFTMGNSRSKNSDEAEHPVTISSLFFSKYEVTQHQWETIMGYNPSIHKGCPTCPVENVSWEEVIKFIRKLNILSNRKFRLPTEAEWEYVSRLGGKAEIDEAGGQEEYIKKTAWFFSNADKRTHPTGTRQPNAAGVFDLMGNVSEWCGDWYGAYYFKEEYSQLNPEGPPLGKEKIIRGGNYKDFVGDRFRPSFRNKKSPVEKGSEIGFRLVMDLVNN